MLYNFFNTNIILKFKRNFIAFKIINPYILFNLRIFDRMSTRYFLKISIFDDFSNNLNNNSNNSIKKKFVLIITKILYERTMIKFIF